MSHPLSTIGGLLAVSDGQANLDFFLRWIHVFAGIVWIGHLYFFNWVNMNFQAVLEKEFKKSVNPKLLPRALFFFRWGAMITFLAGLALFTLIYMYQEGKGFGPSLAFTKPGGGLTVRAVWILIGSGLGTIMWANVWFVIWPAQRKIIPAVRDGVAPDAALVKRATNASKVNTYLSAPMLFGMLGGAGHYQGVNVATVIIVAVLALLTVFVIYKGAPKVQSM